MTILANNDRAHETLRNRILQPEISRAEQRRQRASSSFRPSLPQTPSPPTPIPALTVSSAAGAEANS
jgi:dipeptidase